MRLNAKQIADYTGATVLIEAMDSTRLATGISWDSRDIKPGDVYLALPGERVDGHDFIESALRAGAIVVLVMRRPSEQACLFAREMGAAVLEVSSTSAALTDLAREWRHHLRGKVIALTGSTGKTTTKNLVRDVLSSRFSTVATKANQNNELGVPKTLLEANPETECVVVEMGMRGLGQITELCEFIKPDYALITNCGECHIELLGSRENIARAKAEIIEALPQGTGKAFLNCADGMVDFVYRQQDLSNRAIEVVSFDGTGSVVRPESWKLGPSVWAQNAQLDAQGRPTFTLCARGFYGSTADESCDCALELRGMHNVSNACSAAAIGRAIGMTIEECAAALAHALPESGRQEIFKAAGGFMIINDAYNANPDSMKASLAMFNALDIEGRRFAVLGDMGELGDYAVACHEGVGQYLADLDIDRLICVGDLATNIARAAQAAGFPEQNITVTPYRGEALSALEVELETGDAVLVKASHSMELERIVRGLLS